MRPYVSLRAAFPRSVTLLFAAIIALATMVSTGIVTHASRAAASAPESGQFMPLSPARVIDTTSGSFANSVDGVTHSGKILSNETVNYAFPGHGGVPSSGVLAVVLHVTTLNGSATGVGDGYLWTYPATSGTAAPTQSNDPHPLAGTVQNDGSGQASDNTAIMPLGDDGQVTFYDGSSASAVDLRVDVEGYVSDGTGSAGATYAPLAAYRTVSNHTLSSSAAYAVSLLGVDGLPGSAGGIAAVALNLSASGSTTDCSVAATSATASDPSVAQKVFTYAGGAAEQLVMLPTSSSGSVYLSTDCPSVSTSVDIEGYYLPASTGGAGDLYVPISPIRIVDTRSASNIGIAPGPIAANSTVDGDNAIPVMNVLNPDTGDVLVPDSGVDAVALSVDTFGSSGGTGFVELWSDGETRPTNVSTVGVDSTVNQSDFAFLQPGVGGTVDLYNGPDATNLTVEIDGYFAEQDPPSAPDQVEAYVDGTTGHVSWQAPIENNAGPVTGYQVSITPAAGGEAVASGTYDASTSSASFPGLSATTTYNTSISALNSAGVSDPATALMESDSSGGQSISLGMSATDSYDTEVQIDADGTTTLAGSSADQTVSDNGTITSADDGTGDSTTFYDSPADDPAEADGSSPCVKNTQKNAKIVYVSGWNTSISKAHHQAFWFHQQYRVANARFKASIGGDTYQIMICTSGSATSSGAWNNWFAGDAVFLESTASRMLPGNAKVGTTHSSTIRVPLSFSLSKGVASMTASTVIEPGTGSMTFNNGGDGQFIDWNPANNQYNINRMNLYWHSGHFFPWDGTGDAEGNAGFAKYEFAMPVQTHTFSNKALTEGLCHNVPSVGCGHYN